MIPDQETETVILDHETGTDKRHSKGQIPSPDPVKFGPDPALGLTEDVWHQKYKNKKEFF